MHAKRILRAFVPVDVGPDEIALDDQARRSCERGELAADPAPIVARDEISVVRIQPADRRVGAIVDRKCRRVVWPCVDVPVGSVPMKLPAIMFPPLVWRLMPIR